MKRIELIKKFVERNCQLIRHGGNNDWYQNQKTKVLQQIPRHREINEFLAQHIIKMLS